MNRVWHMSNASKHDLVVQIHERLCFIANVVLHCVDNTPESRFANNISITNAGTLVVILPMDFSVELVVSSI
jgi:hypothetical protein